MTDPRLPKLLSINRGGAELSDARWLKAEDALGIRLPGSYKALIDLYGASSWGNFLHILSPFDDDLNLERVGREILHADRQSRDSFPSHYPFALYPERGGMLPWAVTDNGDTLYFVTLSLPDEWPTLIKGPRDPEFEVSFLPPSLLVHHVAAGSIQSTIIPKL